LNTVAGRKAWATFLDFSPLPGKGARALCHQRCRRHCSSWRCINTCLQTIRQKKYYSRKEIFV
jgi:hypothetical protein